MMPSRSTTKSDWARYRHIIEDAIFHPEFSKRTIARRHGVAETTVRGVLLRNGQFICALKSKFREDIIGNLQHQILTLLDMRLWGVRGQSKRFKAAERLSNVVREIAEIPLRVGGESALEKVWENL